jgi:signal transduction histidine kinase
MTAWQDVLARAHHAQRREPSEDGPPVGANSAALPGLTEQGNRQDRSPPRRGLLLVGAALLAALAVDWFLAPRSYPVAAAYGVSLLVAAHFLSLRGVAVTAGLALVLSVVSNNLQGAPAAAWLADNTGLVGLGLLAVLLARQREVTQAAREVSEAAEAQAAALLESERAARGEADAAVRVRDEFLASASHDLRGPLTTIRGYTALARRRLAAGDTERVLAALTSIEASTKRLTGSLDELLDLAQLQAGQRLALHRVPTDLVALVRRVAADHEVATEQSSIQVLSELPGLNGWWDAARLERALGNLVGNAVKYSPPGAEVRVTLSRQHDAHGTWAVVQVRDQGIGVPAADLPHIFERFHRATNVGGRVPGTGLGLPGAREVVEQHGGEISVQSEEGHGSTFTVRLPLDPEETAAAS